MTSSYLLAGQLTERERLRLQSLVWEPAARGMLEAIPVEAGWKAIDVGCGALGVLRPLSQLTGPAGSVLGVDVDEGLLDSARAFVEEQQLANVEIRRADLFTEDLPAEAFDLVHLRFMFAPIGREAELLARALRLCKRGGVLAVQEPDASTWTLIPPSDAHDRLRNLIVAAFTAGGGDFNVGRRTFSMLAGAGMEQVQIRPAVEALPPGHAYLRIALQFATSLRKRIVDGGIATAAELDSLVSAVEAEIGQSDRCGVTFTVTQVWGRKR